MSGRSAVRRRLGAGAGGAVSAAPRLRRPLGRRRRRVVAGAAVLRGEPCALHASIVEVAPEDSGALLLALLFSGRCPGGACAGGLSDPARQPRSQLARYGRSFKFTPTHPGAEAAEALASSLGAGKASAQRPGSRAHGADALVWMTPRPDRSSCCGCGPMTWRSSCAMPEGPAVGAGVSLRLVGAARVGGAASGMEGAGELCLPVRRSGAAGRDRADQTERWLDEAGLAHGRAFAPRRMPMPHAIFSRTRWRISRSRRRAARRAPESRAPAGGAGNGRQQVQRRHRPRGPGQPCRLLWADESWPGSALRRPWRRFFAMPRLESQADPGEPAHRALNRSESRLPHPMNLPSLPTREETRSPAALAPRSLPPAAPRARAVDSCAAARLTPARSRR